jgi:stage III sporulation protein SpoIIIAA
MDLGRVPIARVPSGDVKLSAQPITPEDLAYAVQQVRVCVCVCVWQRVRVCVCSGSITRLRARATDVCVWHMYSNLTNSQVGDFGGDNRAGIDRTLHRISAIRNRTGKVIGACRARAGPAIHTHACLQA